MELTNDNIWIYPAYFQIKRNQCIEITIIFKPISAGLYTEMFYLMCNNNSFQEIEVIGDALVFEKSLINLKVFTNYVNYVLFIIYHY